MKIFLLWTNSSKAEHFTVWNGDIAMEGMATVHAEILMYVGGFSIEVCTYPAIFEVDRCAPKLNLFCWPCGSKIDSLGGGDNAGSQWSSIALVFQGSTWQKMSSMNLHHTRGSISWVGSNSHSSFPMNKFAYEGAIRVPIAVPWIYYINSRILCLCVSVCL